MARRLVAGVLLASITGLSVVGCGGSDGDKAKKNGPEIAWAGKVCDAVGQGSANLRLPTFQNPKDAKSVRAGYLTFLGSLSTQLKTVEASLQGAAPEVAGGQAAQRKALANLKATQAALEGATNEVRKAKTTNIKSFQSSIAKLNQVMAKYSDYAGPVQDLRATPALSIAFDKAPSCQSRKL